MATQVQFRGGTTTEHSSFNGAAREVTVDTTKQTLVVQDGTTNGGFPLLRENGIQSLTTTGNIYIDSDSSKLWLGDDADLGVSHSGAHGLIKNSTGSLYLATGALLVQNAAQTANQIISSEGAGVQLFFDGGSNPKLATNAGGVDITGVMQCDGITLLDNEQFQCGTNVDLRIYHDLSSGDNFIKNSVAGRHLKVTASNDDAMAIFYQGSSCALYYNGGKRFETDSSGAIIVGAEDGDANLFLYADEGDDDADKWLIQSESDGYFALKNYKDGGGNWEMSIKATGAAGVELYYDNVKRFHTLNHGAYVTGDFEVFADTASNYVSQFKNDGANTNRYGINIQCGADDAAGTNTAVRFADGDGTQQGLITFSGGTVSYGAFTAHHPCIVPDSENPSDSSNAYPYGTLLETISIEYTQKNGADTERGIRYKVQKTQSANSRKVLGAYGSSMNGGPDGQTNEHQALVLGDGHILVNNAGGNIEVGDGICSSAVAGIGQKATANPSMVIGIAQEAVTFTGSETKLVAVQYGLQQFTPWS